MWPSAGSSAWASCASCWTGAPTASAVAAVLRRAEIVQMVLLSLGMPLFFLSGFSWPIESLPPLLRAAAQAIPSTAMIEGYVRSAQMGAGLAELAPLIRHLWLLAFAYAGITLLLRLGASGSRLSAARPEVRSQEAGDAL